MAMLNNQMVYKFEWMFLLLPGQVRFFEKVQPTKQSTESRSLCNTSGRYTWNDKNWYEVIPNSKYDLQ